jgi:hypothetical protein
MLDHDALHVMLQVGMFLAKAAILTAITGPASDEVARRRVYLLLDRGFQVQASFQFEDRDEVRSIDQRFVLRPLGVSQGTLVCPFRKHRDALLDRRVEL